MSDPRELARTYRQQLDGQFRRLAFEPGLEEQFRDSHFRRLAGFMRLGQWLAVILYLVFALARFVAGPLDDYLLVTTAWRLCIVASLLSMAWMIGRMPHRRLQHFIAGNYLLFALCLAGISSVSIEMDRAYRYEGILYAIFHCALFGCLLFRHCLFTLGVMTVIYVLLCALSGVQGRELAYQTFFVLMAVILAGFSRYQVEYAERDGFLRRHLMFVMANFDELTGLASRAAFDRYLRQYLRRSAAGERRLQAVVLLDIDFFKQLNDSRGHDTGDKCLQLVAEILKQHVGGDARASARWGGDELIAVFPADSEDALRARLETIRRDVEKLRMDNPGSPFGRLTVSIGAVMIAPEKRLGEKLIFRAADAALYRAKQDGRDRVVIQTAAAAETTPSPVAAAQAAQAPGAA